MFKIGNIYKVEEVYKENNIYYVVGGDGDVYKGDNLNALQLVDVNDDETYKIVLQLIDRK